MERCVNERQDRHQLMKAIREGATLFDGENALGTVTGFISRGGEARTDLLVAVRDSGEEIIVPAVRLDLARSTPERLLLIRGERPGPDPATETIPLTEERLAVDVRERDRGVVRIRKEVEVTPVHETVDVRRDDIRIERRQVDQPVDAIRNPWYEGETLVVPVYEEVIVTEKRMMLREEIRIARHSVTEPVTIDETVRRHRIDIEHIEPDSDDA
jgi:uncharacterized protein (TIGR02271 family)